MSARAPGSRSMRVHIDEIVLEGFDPRQRFRIADAIERELVRLLTAQMERGEVPQPRVAARVDGGSFTFRAHDPPARIGAAIARATVRGLAPANRGAGRRERE